MPAFPKEIAAFMERYKVSFDEVWKIPQGNAYAVKHKALERVAAEQGIVFNVPDIIQTDIVGKAVALIVHGRLGERTDWATGEAAPYNNKNAYPYAMAEKRAKDRVTLKLLTVHGALYSEDEADDFKRPNPHVTTPDDISDAVVEYDQHGEPIDNIPLGDPSIERLPKAKCRADFEIAGKAMMATQTIKQLQDWAERSANLVASFPADWDRIIRKRYAEHRDELRNGRAAA